MFIFNYREKSRGNRMNRNKQKNIENDNDANIVPIASKEEFERLILENQNFAYSIVNKEFSKYPWSIKPELNSAAIEGLIYAATKYDPSRQDECKFISYAVHWIRYYINEEIRKLYPVKLNQNFVSKRKKVTSFIAKYEDKYGKTPSINEISKNVGMSEKVVQGILNINGGENFQFVSFNSPSNVGDSEGNESFNESKLVGEYLETSCDYSGQAKIELKDLLRELKKKTSEDDYNIFYDYYINGESYSDLAVKYGLKFPSSVSYIVKKCEKICKALV